ATFEASNSNCTSLQPLVYVPREERTLGKINQDTASLQYLARVRDRSSGEVP
ncbi:hypothetical protein BDW62DRAFT_185473, partial [Aspergillus aurantiobrunneus]